MRRDSQPDALRRRCWLLTAALVITGSLSRAWLTQSAELALMVTLVWGGAVCCLEDQLPLLRPRPTAAGFAVGLVLLLLVQWRLERLVHPQSVMLVLPLLQGLGLLLLLGPVRLWRQALDPLLVLALLPLQALVGRLLPTEPLSELTARLCQLLFLCFGVDASVLGAELRLPSGGVTVAGPCSGNGLMMQLLVVGGIFALVFPLLGGRRRWLALLGVLVVAPLFGLAANTLRIALLAAINASSWPNRQWWFDTFHDGDGGLLFAGLAVMVFAPCYFHLQDRLLERRQP